MQYYQPRLILLNSDTMINNNFLCGFISFPEGNTNTVSPGKLYPAENDNPPYLLYLEDDSIKDGAPTQLLPQFTFNTKDEFPKELDVEFENIGGKKSPKIKVTATMGHPDTDLPLMYVPRVFTLTDMNKNGDGSGAVVYGFLMDIYQGEIIRYEATDWTDVIVSVNSDNQNPDIINTAILLFPLNAILPSFTLDLEGQGKGQKLISYKAAPGYGTLDQ